MPEIIEVEMYRRGAGPLIGRTIASVDAPDAWYLKGIDAHGLTAALTGAQIERIDRIGKLMILRTTAGAVGLRFGMTGRLVVDDEPIIASLEYSAKRLSPEWSRFGLRFAGAGAMVMNDPRRLGGVTLEPDLSQLGPDVWSIGQSGLAQVLGSTSVALKTRLLDQKRVAGLGNLLVDELCWRVGVTPGRSCSNLSIDEVQALAAHVGPMLDELYDRGGSHTGDHFEARGVDMPCPRDGAAMLHATIGGRSTWWCSTHQS